MIDSWIHVTGFLCKDNLFRELPFKINNAYYS